MAGVIAMGERLGCPSWRVAGAVNGREALWSSAEGPLDRSILVMTMPHQRRLRGLPMHPRVLPATDPDTLHATARGAAYGRCDIVSPSRVPDAR